MLMMPWIPKTEPSGSAETPGYVWHVVSREHASMYRLLCSPGHACGRIFEQYLQAATCVANITVLWLLRMLDPWRLEISRSTPVGMLESGSNTCRSHGP